MAKDVEKVQQAMKPLDGAKSSLAKHVTSLKNLMKTKKDSIVKLEAEVRMKKAEIKGYLTSLNKLERDPSVAASIIKKKKSKIAATIFATV